MIIFHYAKNLKSIDFIRSWSNIGALKDQRIFISGQVWKIVIFARSNNAIFKFFLAPYKKSFKNLFWTWPSWLHRDFCTGFEFFWNYFRYYFFKYLPALIDPENLRQIIWLESLYSFIFLHFAENQRPRKNFENFEKGFSVPHEWSQNFHLAECRKTRKTNI